MSLMVRNTILSGLYIGAIFLILFQANNCYTLFSYMTHTDIPIHIMCPVICWVPGKKCSIG